MNFVFIFALVPGKVEISGKEEGTEPCRANISSSHSPLPDCADTLRKLLVVEEIAFFSPPRGCGHGRGYWFRGQDSRGLAAGTGRHAGIARAHAGWALKAPIG